MASFAGLRLDLRVVCPSCSLSSVTVVMLGCRALRRVGLSVSIISTSRLALRKALVRDARAGCGVFALDGGCGVGVLRRLADRTLRRSAIAHSIDA
jgi:hypothetical protein